MVNIALFLAKEEGKEELGLSVDRRVGWEWPWRSEGKIEQGQQRIIVEKRLGEKARGLWFIL